MKLRFFALVIPFNCSPVIPIHKRVTDQRFSRLSTAMNLVMPRSEDGLLMNQDASPRREGTASRLSTVTKNFNFYWLAATTLALWFLFYHTPPFLVSNRRWADFLLLVHIGSAGTVYLACAHNALVTPSVNRLLHIWVGRTGLVFGILGFFTGLYMVLSPKYATGAFFGVAITIGGVFQMVSQYLGFTSIREFQSVRKQLDQQNPSNADLILVEQLQEQRKRLLRNHIGYMLGVFVLACGIPAILRVASDAGQDNAIAIVAAIFIAQLVCKLYQIWFFKTLDPKPPIATALSESSSLLS